MKIVLFFLFILVLLSTIACTPVQETTTTTWIEYTQYELVGKEIVNWFGPNYRMYVKINNDKVERWKVDADEYFRFEVGDFFYQKRIHQHGTDSKELLPGKIPQ